MEPTEPLEGRLVGLFNRHNPGFQGLGPGKRLGNGFLLLSFNFFDYLLIALNLVDILAGLFRLF